MATELAIPTTGDWGDWNPQQRAMCEFMGLVKKQGDQMVPAPEGIRAAFIYEVHRTGLDPMAHQIYAAEIGGKWTILVGIDGLRLIAQRSKEYQGQEAPEWSDGTFVDQIVPVLLPDGTVFMVDDRIVTKTERVYNWQELWLETERPKIARVRVWRKGFKEPSTGLATWQAYGKTSGQWVDNGPHMLAKCAEALALRKAFPLETSGLYIPEEFANGTVADADQTREWEAEANAEDMTLARLKVLYEELRASGEWTGNLDAKFRARKAELMVAEENETIVVPEGETANA